MVTGVSHSLFYKLCLLAELNRCWKTSLWLIRNKVSVSAHLPCVWLLTLGTHGAHSQNGRARSFWRLGPGRHGHVAPETLPTQPRLPAASVAAGSSGLPVFISFKKLGVLY